MVLVLACYHCCCWNFIHAFTFQHCMQATRLCWSSSVRLYLWLHRHQTIGCWRKTSSPWNPAAFWSNNIHICSNCLHIQTSQSHGQKLDWHLIWNKQFHIYTKDFLSHLQHQEGSFSTDNHTHQDIQMSSLKVLLSDLLKDELDTVLKWFQPSTSQSLQLALYFPTWKTVSSRWHIVPPCWTSPAPWEVSIL